MTVPFRLSGSIPVEVARSWSPLTAGPGRLWDAPWESPPPGAIYFIGQSRATITGAAGSDTTAILAQHGVPEHFAAVVKNISYQINDVTATTNAQFTFRVNQGVVPGFQVDIFPKVASHDQFEFNPNKTSVTIPVGADMDVLARIRAGDLGTYLMGAIYWGWYYPEDRDTVEAG